MTVPTRPLGRSGMDITVVGAGSWAIGGSGWKYGWGPQDDASSVRAGAVSNFDVALLERCESIRHVDSLQAGFSMINRAAVGDVIPWCEQHQTGVICYSPLQAGLLTDSFSPERVMLMHPGDWRRWHPDLATEFNEPKLSRNLELRDALHGIAARHAATTAAVALAWLLAWPGVTGAIVGSRSPDQVDGWVGSGGVELSDDDLDKIAGAIERTGAGSGPVRPPAMLSG